MGLSLTRYLHLKLIETDDLRKLHGSGGPAGATGGGIGLLMTTGHTGGGSAGSSQRTTPIPQRCTPSNKVRSSEADAPPASDQEPNMETAESAAGAAAGGHVSPFSGGLASPSYPPMFHPLAGRVRGGGKVTREREKEGSRLEVTEYSSYDAAANGNNTPMMIAAAAGQAAAADTPAHSENSGRRKGTSGLVAGNQVVSGGAGGRTKSREENPLLQQLDDLQQQRSSARSHKQSKQHSNSHADEQQQQPQQQPQPPAAAAVVLSSNGTTQIVSDAVASGVTVSPAPSGRGAGNFAARKPFQATPLIIQHDNAALTLDNPNGTGHFQIWSDEERARERGILMGEPAEHRSEQGGQGDGDDDHHSPTAAAAAAAAANDYAAYSRSSADDYYESFERDTLETPFLVAVQNSSLASTGVAPPPPAAPSTIIKWKKGELLGFGAYGHVYLGLNLENGQLMAVKQVPLLYTRGQTTSKLSDLAVQALESEIAMMRHLPKHENIVAYLGTLREKEASTRGTPHSTSKGERSPTKNGGGGGGKGASKLPSVSGHTSFLSSPPPHAAHGAAGGAAPGDSVDDSLRTDSTILSQPGQQPDGPHSAIGAGAGGVGHQTDSSTPSPAPWADGRPSSDTPNSQPSSHGGHGGGGGGPKMFNIFLEYVPGGSIASLLKKFGRFNEGLVRIYIKQILNGLRFLHQHGVIHRDVKGANVLVSQGGLCKLCDFGAASNMQDLGDNRMNLCLAVGTEVRLADGRIKKVEEVGVYEVLKGETEDVSVLHKYTGVSAEMYRVTHADGFSYTVTPDHLVTLRWEKSPEAVIEETPAAASTSSEPASTNQRRAFIQWWEWDGKQLQSFTSAPLARFPSGLTPDDIRRYTFAESFHSVRAQGGPGFHALYRGDLVDLPASYLARADVWRMVVQGGLARSRKVDVTGNSPVEEAEATHAGQKEEFPTGTVMYEYHEAADRFTYRRASEEERAGSFQEIESMLSTGAGGVPASGSSKSAVEQVASDPSGPVDSVSLAFCLEDHYQPNTRRAHRKSTSHRNIEAALKLLQTAATAALDKSSTTRSHFRLSDHRLASFSIDADPTSLPSSVLSVSVQSSMLSMVRRACRRSRRQAILSFGALNEMRWRRVDQLEGVTQVEHRSTPEGAPFTRFQFHSRSADHESSSSKEGASEITVWYTGDSLVSSRVPEIVLVLGSALHLDVSSALASSSSVGTLGDPLASLTLLDTPHRFVALKVTAPLRFALANGTITHNCGTPYFMSPETVKQCGSGRQADIWSLGCMVIEMVSGKPPWSEFPTHVAAMLHIATTTQMPYIPAELSDEAKHFTRACLHRDPKQRPNADRLLRHPFVTGKKLAEVHWVARGPMLDTETAPGHSLPKLIAPPAPQQQPMTAAVAGGGGASVGAVGISRAQYYAQQAPQTGHPSTAVHPLTPMTVATQPASPIDMSIINPFGPQSGAAAPHGDAPLTGGSADSGSGSNPHSGGGGGSSTGGVGFRPHHGQSGLVRQNPKNAAEGDLMFAQMAAAQQQQQQRMLHQQQQPNNHLQLYSDSKSASAAPSAESSMSPRHKADVAASGAFHPQSQVEILEVHPADDDERETRAARADDAYARSVRFDEGALVIQPQVRDEDGEEDDSAVPTKDEELIQDFLIDQLNGDILARVQDPDFIRPLSAVVSRPGTRPSTAVPGRGRAAGVRIDLPQMPMPMATQPARPPQANQIQRVDITPDATARKRSVLSPLDTSSSSSAAAHHSKFASEVTVVDGKHRYEFAADGSQIAHPVATTTTMNQSPLPAKTPMSTLARRDLPTQQHPQLSPLPSSSKPPPQGRRPSIQWDLAQGQPSQPSPKTMHGQGRRPSIQHDLGQNPQPSQASPKQVQKLVGEGRRASNGNHSPQGGGGTPTHNANPYSSSFASGAHLALAAAGGANPSVASGSPKASGLSSSTSPAGLGGSPKPNVNIASRRMGQRGASGLATGGSGAYDHLVSPTAASSPISVSPLASPTALPAGHPPASRRPPTSQLVLDAPSSPAGGPSAGSPLPHKSGLTRAERAAIRAAEIEAQWEADLRAEFEYQQMISGTTGPATAGPAVGLGFGGGGGFGFGAQQPTHQTSVGGSHAEVSVSRRQRGNSLSQQHGATTTANTKGPRVRHV